MTDTHTHARMHTCTHARTHARTHTHTHTQPFNGLLSGTTRVGRYQKKHSPLTPILIIGHPLSSSSIYNDPWHPLCSVYELDSPLGQHLSRSSLVFLLALDPQLHTPCISSPNHHLFAAHELGGAQALLCSKNINNTSNKLLPHWQQKGRIVLPPTKWLASQWARWCSPKLPFPLGGPGTT